MDHNAPSWTTRSHGPGTVWTVRLRPLSPTTTAMTTTASGVGFSAPTSATRLPPRRRCPSRLSPCEAPSG
eukprot:496009-Rhodomonas_salina.1